METLYPASQNWWTSFRFPHPVPNHTEPQARLKSVKERQDEDRQLRDKTNRLTKRLAGLQSRAAIERRRAELERGNPTGHARASLKHINTLNVIIDVKEQLEALRLQQEEA